MADTIEAGKVVLDIRELKPAPIYVIDGFDSRVFGTAVNGVAFLRRLQDDLREKFGGPPRSPSLIVLPPGTTIQEMDEESMRAAGWVRAH